MSYTVFYDVLLLTQHVDGSPSGTHSLHTRTALSEGITELIVVRSGSFFFQEATGFVFCLFFFSCVVF